MILKDSFESKLNLINKIKNEYNEEINKLWTKINSLENSLREKDDKIDNLETLSIDLSNSLKEYAMENLNYHGEDHISNSNNQKFGIIKSNNSLINQKNTLNDTNT